MRTKQNIHYEYSDVVIMPGYSDITTRRDVDTGTKLTSHYSDIVPTMKVPVISSNMDTVTEFEMCNAVRSGGGMAAIHRFLPIGTNVQQFQHVFDPSGAWVSIGVNRDSKERAEALHRAGARQFVVDIAHGHTVMMREILGWMRETFGRDVFVMGGNVGTPEAVQDLITWGADAVKVGIGGGNVCTTKDVTGVVTPMFSLVQDCCAISEDHAIVADGGARSYGDIAKAIGAGASAVMSGYFFAGCPETPARSRVQDPATGAYVSIYRGMASRDAMAVIRAEDKGLPTPEGRSVDVQPKVSAAVVVDEIAGGLRSAYSYVGARSTSEFQYKVKFGYRR